METDPTRVPAEFRHMVGMASAQKALQRLLETSQKHGFKLIVYPYERDPGGQTRNAWFHAAMALQREYGVPALDLRPLVPEFMAQGTGTAYNPRDFVISPEDPHPSALHHQLIAEGLYRLIQESGLLIRLIEGDVRFHP